MTSTPPTDTDSSRGEALVDVRNKIWASIKRAMFKDAEPFFDEVARHCIDPHLAALSPTPQSEAGERVLGDPPYIDRTERFSGKSVREHPTAQTEGSGLAEELAAALAETDWELTAFVRENGDRILTALSSAPADVPRAHLEADHEGE